jgi:hypothetical protein
MRAAGVAARAFECLGKAEINIQLVSTRNQNRGADRGEQADNAASIIHREFGLTRAADVAATPSLGPSCGTAKRGGLRETREITPKEDDWQKRQGGSAAPRAMLNLYATGAH